MAGVYAWFRSIFCCCLCCFKKDKRTNSKKSEYDEECQRGIFYEIGTGDALKTDTDTAEKDSQYESYQDEKPPTQISSESSQAAKDSSEQIPPEKASKGDSSESIHHEIIEVKHSSDSVQAENILGKDSTESILCEICSSSKSTQAEQVVFDKESQQESLSSEKDSQSGSEHVSEKDSIDSLENEKVSVTSECIQVIEKESQSGSVSSENTDDSTEPILTEGSLVQYEILSDADSSESSQSDKDIHSESSDDEALRRYILDITESEGALKSISSRDLTNTNDCDNKDKSSKFQVMKVDFEVKEPEIFTFSSQNLSNEPIEERKIETYCKKQAVKSSNPILEVPDTVQFLLDEVESQVNDDPIDSPKKLRIQRPNTLLVVNGEQYSAHKQLLIEESTYFREMFADNRNKDAVVHIQSEFLIPRVFKAILTFLYTDLLVIPSRDILTLCGAAEHLGMENLTNACVDALDLSVDNLKNVFNVYQASCQMRDRDSKEQTLKILAANLESILMENDFLELTHRQVVEIFSEPIIGARSESVLFLAALRWLAHDFLDRERHAVALLRCIHFSSLTLREALACFHPPILPGVAQIPEVRTMLLNATCYICAKAVRKEHFFNHLKPRERVLLFKDKPLILWNTEKHRPDLPLTRAAVKIQAVYRGYRARKALSDSPDPEVKKWYEAHSTSKFVEKEIERDSSDDEDTEPRASPPASNYRLFLLSKSQGTRIFPDDLE